MAIISFLANFGIDHYHLGIYFNYTFYAISHFNRPPPKLLKNSAHCSPHEVQDEGTRKLTPRLSVSGVGLRAVGDPIAKELPTPARPRFGRGRGPRPDKLELGLGLKPPGAPPLPSSVGKLSWRSLPRRSSALVVIVVGACPRSP